MKKRILSFLLALLMVAGMFPTQTFATDSIEASTEPDPHTHIYTDGKCECGEVCAHAEYADGKCKVCGMEEPHTHIYTDGKCACGEVCAHAEYADGKCKVCGMEEPHTHIYNDGKCACGEVCAHAEYGDGKCKVCGADETADDEDTSPFHANIGRKAQFDLTYTNFPVVDDPTGITNVFDASINVSRDVIPAELIVKIVDCYVNKTADIYWYKVEAAEGHTLPAEFSSPAWVFQDNVSASHGSSLILLEEEPEDKCPICGETDCTTEHKKCEICEEYDCIKIHFYCNICEDYDCGKSHPICPACGEVDCEKAHTWCPYCGGYDCGMEHEDEYKPDTAPVIPNNPTLTPNADVSIVDEYGDAVTAEGLFLEDGTKTSISAWPIGEADSYQWQICYNNANDLWANIQGETGKGILISPAMFLNIISYQGTAAIRCVATVGGETKVSASIPVTVMEVVPQQEIMMFSDRSGGEKEAVPTADVEYSIVIDYKFRDGSKAANSWTASLAQGADYILDVESPAVVGYKPDQARITETITNFTGTRIITVYYDPDIVEFKVIHHQQNITGNEYTVYRTDTKQGYTGTQVGTDLQESFTGFDQLNYDDTLVIAADGSTVVNIYYDREYYIVRLNLNGGFGAEPICARYGTPVNIADPQRTGYAFAGWSPALPTFVEKETSHTAQWTKADAGFTVAFWYENANDNDYTFVGSVQQTATTGTTVNGSAYEALNNVNNGEHFDGFDADYAKHFTTLNTDKTDKNVTINADGTSVVNVYFYRNTYLLEYYYYQCHHTHSSGCYTSTLTCTKAVHTQHVKSCQSNLGNKVTNSGNVSELNSNTPNATDGSWGYFEVKVFGLVIDTYYCVYWGGTWYHLSGTDESIKWGNCPGMHSHSSTCYRTDLTCGHGTGFYCGCSNDLSNTDRWYAAYSEYHKYEEYVGDIHMQMGTGSGYRLIDVYRGGVATGETPASGGAVGTFASMLGGYTSFYRAGDGGSPFYMTYWLESADGSGTRTFDGKTFVKSTTFFTMMGHVSYKNDYEIGVPHGFDAYKATFGTTDNTASATETFTNYLSTSQNSTSPYNNFYYIRETYDLTYFNGSTQVATRTMKFEEPLTSTYNLQNLSMTSPYGNGYYFAGWYLDPECTIPVSWGSTKMPEGGMAVYAKWAPSTHIVTTYQTKNGTKLNTYSITHGEAYSGTVSKPVNGVYNFVGWFYEEDGEKKSYDFSMPVYKDMVLWAEWTSDVQVSGTITYIDRATGKALAQSSPISGQVGATKTYEAKVGSQLNATGYFPEVTSHNIEFSANESQNNWIFYYNAMKDVPYEVRYINGATGEPMAASDFGTTNEPSLSFKAKTFKGYSADAYEKTLIVSSDETLNVVIFTYTEDTVHAPVQVVHYIQNTTGNGYTRYLTEEAYQGTIGQNQYKTPLNIDGFTYNETKSKNGMKLTEDGLQLELYYDRNTYSYKFLFEDTAGNTLRDAVEGDGLYGSLMEYTTQSIPGYRLTTPGTLTITIGTNAENNVKTFVYEERTATIRYEVGAVKGGTVTPASEAVLAVNGTAAGAVAQTNTNYKFVGWYTDYACTEANKVGSNETFIPQKTADSVYVDAVYYAKFEEVKVTLYYSVVMPDGAAAKATLTKTSEQVSVYTGRAAGSSVDTVPDGYRFEGWYDADGNKLTGNTSYTPPRTDDPWVNGTTYYARFIEKKAAINYVAVGNGAVSPGSEEVNMVTGAASGATATATENIARFVGWYDNAACEGTALSTDAAFAPALPSGGWAETQTYYAKFENIQYTITFEDRSETVGTQTYAYGGTLTLPEVTNENYVVTWTVKENAGDWAKDSEVTNGTINHYGDVTLVANWTIDAIWIDWDFNIPTSNEDDILYSQSNVPYGTDPVYAGDLSTDDLAARRNTAQYTYTFKEWVEEDLSAYETLLGDEVRGIIVYRADYEKTVNKYTVTWQDDEGNTIDTTEVEYGTIPTHDGPTKDATAEYTYTFAGWTPEVVAVTGDATYKATFTEAKRSYTITWLNDDDSVIDTTTVAYGEVPTHADPSKAATAEYTYTFAGWSPDVVAVTGEATYKATYTAEKNTYTITWKNEDGTVLETDTNVEYGTMPSYDGETPTKERHNQYTYTFRAWSPEIVAVTGDAVYIASFDPHENFYTVTWVNHDGEVLETDKNVAWDTMPEYNGDTPEKTGNAEHSYTFAGWSPTVSKVNGHATYTATFAESVNTYTVTWKNEDGTVLETDEDMVYGTMPSYDGETPEKAATAQYTYTFDGWDKDVVAVTGDVTYTAKFSATVNKYTVTFVDEDGTTILMAAAEYEYGTAAEDIVKPTDPTKEATAEFTYSFAGWTPKIADVTGNAIYTATYSAVVNQYTLSVEWGTPAHGGSISPSESVTVSYGEQAEITYRTKDGYRITHTRVNGQENQNGLLVMEEKYTANLMDKDIHIIAYTAPIEFTITYNLDDGVLPDGITTNTQNYTIEQQFALMEAPTKAGYKFTGWKLTEVLENYGNWENGTFQAGQEFTGKYGWVTFTAQWERALVDLTITTTSADQEQSYIFTVSGTPSDSSYGTITLDVVLVGTDSITIKDLPVGEYTVTEKDGWSWREDSVDSKTADLRTTSQTVSFDFYAVDDLHWLSGYSYKRKKGGS